MGKFKVLLYTYHDRIFEIEKRHGKKELYGNREYDEQYGVGNFEVRRQILSDTLRRLFVKGIDLEPVQ